MKHKPKKREKDATENDSMCPICSSMYSLDVGKAMEETGYNVLAAYGSMMIAYLKLLLKLSYKRRRLPSYIVALNVLTMMIINVFDFCKLYTLINIHGRYCNLRTVYSITELMAICNLIHFQPK